MGLGSNKEIYIDRTIGRDSEGREWCVAVGRNKYLKVLQTLDVSFQVWLVERGLAFTVAMNQEALNGVQFPGGV